MIAIGRIAAAFLGCVAGAWIGCGGRGGEAERQRTVVFVCEHGAAKSVVAAALFNARAARRGLPLRAESRGVAPEAALLPAAVAGLERDGMTPGRAAPRRIAREDVEAAAAVVAFDPLPADVAGQAVRTWSVPPVSADYAAARDAMLPRIDALLDELARGGKDPGQRAE